MERKRLEPETDPQKLVKFACGANFYKEGSDPEIKPDSEYPDWLWTLWTQREKVPLEELEPDSYAYWRRIKIANTKERARQRKLDHRFSKF